MILEELGIYGWPERDENLLLVSLLTGDPLLLIGNHGCAKTHVANKVAQVLGREFLVYDASKAMFEDVLGYPNVEKLKHGVVEYVPSPVTIWDKELVFIDELNRAVPELQSKWLEIVRSRKIMGFPTRVRWVWAAMNPVTYAGANTLDDALVGRFALFLYPPDVLQMSEVDRIRVARHINGDDAPSLRMWVEDAHIGTVPKGDIEAVGTGLNELLRKAGSHFLCLKREMDSLSEFLAKFSDLLVRETGGTVALDGRRLGFLYRNLLANRAVELAKAEVFHAPVPEFIASSRHVVQSSIPVGLNESDTDREEAQHKMEICFDLLSSYFEQGAELSRVNLIYELFTNPDLLRKTELLLTCDLGELVLSKAWTDLMKGSRDITLLAYTALQVEVRRPGTVPQELLASLSARIQPGDLSTKCIAALHGLEIEHIEQVEQLLQQDSDLAKLIAWQRVTQLVDSESVLPTEIQATARQIREDIDRFEVMLAAPKQKKELAA